MDWKRWEHHSGVVIVDVDEVCSVLWNRLADTEEKEDVEIDWPVDS